MLPHRLDSPTPHPALEGGEVLAAGRARGPDANPAPNPKPLSVKAFSMPPRVRCAGLRPPLTSPKTPLLLRSSNRPCTRKGKVRLVNFHSKLLWAWIGVADGLRRPYSGNAQLDAHDNFMRFTLLCMDITHSHPGVFHFLPVIKV